MAKNLRLLPVNSDDIPHIVKDVKDSRCFGRSQRQMKLFEYLLEHSRVDNDVQPSQYSIALDVIGRPESFDAATDSIVRVEMHRLRANLEIYNNSESKYKISVPPASFQVSVLQRKKGLSGAWAKNSKLIMAAGVTSIAVVSLGFASISSPTLPSDESCAKDKPNLNISYIGAPSNSRDYVESLLRSTLSEHSGFNLLKAGQTCGKGAAPSFDVKMTLLEEDGRLSLSLNVLDEDHAKIVESHHAAGMIADARPGTALYLKIAEIGNSIALPSGTLAREAYSHDWGLADYKRSYGCLISMYNSFAGELDSEFDTVHSCLEQSVKSGFATLDNYGALASSYLDQARNNRPSTVADPFAAAEQILEDHENSWLDSAELTIAKLYHEAYREDFNSERMLLILEMAKAKYNKNPQVLLNSAIFYGYTLGQWEEAKRISEFIKRIYSIRDQSVFIVDAGYSFTGLEPGASYAPCYKFYGANDIYANIIVNACARLDGNKEWINKTESRLAALNMTDFAKRIDLLSTRIRDDEFMRRLSGVYKYN